MDKPAQEAIYVWRCAVVLRISIFRPDTELSILYLVYISWIFSTQQPPALLRKSSEQLLMLSLHLMGSSSEEMTFKDMDQSRRGGVEKWCEVVWEMGVLCARVKTWGSKYCPWSHKEPDKHALFRLTIRKSVVLRGTTITVSVAWVMVY